MLLCSGTVDKNINAGRQVNTMLPVILFVIPFALVYSVEWGTFSTKRPKLMLFLSHVGKQ